MKVAIKIVLVFFCFWSSFSFDSNKIKKKLKKHNKQTRTIFAHYLYGVWAPIRFLYFFNYANLRCWLHMSVILSLDFSGFSLFPFLFCFCCFFIFDFYSVLSTQFYVIQNGLFNKKEKKNKKPLWMDQFSIFYFSRIPLVYFDAP